MVAPTRRKRNDEDSFSPILWPPSANHAAGIAQ
jgi:hypothetical protein